MKKTSTDVLCQDNTFLVRWSVDVFVTLEGIHLYISLLPDVAIGRVINIIKLGKFIEGNPLLSVREIVPTIDLRLTLLVDRRENSPQLRGTRVIRIF